MQLLSSSAIRFGLLGLVMGGVLISSGGLSQAADLFDVPGYRPAPPPYAGPPEPPLVYREGRYDREDVRPPDRWARVRGGIEHCRVVHERRPDGYGGEILRRVRVCDDRADRHERDWRAPQRFGYEQPRDFAPRPPHRVRGEFADDGEW